VIVAALATAALFVTASAAFAATFDPLYVISDDNMRAENSMSVAQIQAFLETQPGVLKDLVARDYDKVITLSKKTNNLNITPDKGETPKAASRIIWEACQAWRISPKVMLTMLQKEQSLLTRTTLGSTTLARAVGAGCPGSLVYPDTNPVATNRYPGFGNQIWHGARLLSSYGETNPSFPSWSAGKRIQIYNPHFAADWVYHKSGNHYIAPKNLGTYKLYVYNPSIGAKPPFGDLSGQSCAGNANFWKIYSKYFGSPLAHPRMRTVYRFRNRYNGTYLYTASIAERHKLKKYPRKWDYGGASFSWDTSVPVSATKPVWRFYNRSSHKYSFTSDPAKYTYRRSAKGDDTWKYGGVAWRVSTPSKYTEGAQIVYRFKNRSTGGYLLTASASTVSKLRSSRYASKWRYFGPWYYLPRYKAPL